MCHSKAEPPHKYKTWHFHAASSSLLRPPLRLTWIIYCFWISLLFWANRSWLTVCSQSAGLCSSLNSEPFRFQCRAQGRFRWESNLQPLHWPSCSHPEILCVKHIFQMSLTFVEKLLCKVCQSSCWTHDVLEVKLKLCERLKYHRCHFLYVRRQKADPV